MTNDEADATGPGDATGPVLSEEEREEIRARVCAMAGLMAAETCRWLELVEELDRTHAWSGWGVKSCAHWLSWACSMGAGTAREHVRVARLLPGLPLIWAAFAAGELSYSKVREATRVAGRIEEDALLRLARSCTASQLERAVRGFRRADGARLGQELTRKVRWRTTEDGSFVVTATLPAEEGAVLLAALDTATAALAEEITQQQQTPRPDAADATRWSTPDGRAARAGADPAQTCERGQPPVDPADALLAVAHGYLTAAPDDRSGEDRHLVVVHVDPQVLAAGAAPLDVPAGTTRPADEPARPPTDEPAGPPTGLPATGRRGVVLNYGRKRRLVSPGQRRALAVRDGCCQHPGCTRTHGLEAHHVVHWSRGGRTDLANLVLLCRFHHLAVHEGIIAIGTDRRVTQPDGGPLPDQDAIRRGLYRTVTEHEQLQIRRRLDEIPERHWSWNDPQAETIRPLWRGERFDIGHVVATTFTRLAA